MKPTQEKLSTFIRLFYSIHLCIGEIHLRMLSLELAQHLQLPLLIACRLTHLLLSLVIHHLPDHALRLAVQVTHAAVLGRDLGDVDLRGRGDDVRPPLHLVGLVKVNFNHL
jgi:hypothetical protein